MRFAYFALPSLALALPVVNNVAGPPNYFNDLNKLGGQVTKDWQKGATQFGKGANQFGKGATQFGNQGLKELEKGVNGWEKGASQAFKEFKIPGIKTVDTTGIDPYVTFCGISLLTTKLQKMSEPRTLSRHKRNAPTPIPV